MGFIPGWGGWGVIWEVQSSVSSLKLRYRRHRCLMQDGRIGWRGGGRRERVLMSLPQCYCLIFFLSNYVHVLDTNLKSCISYLENETKFSCMKCVKMQSILASSQSILTSTLT